MAYEYLNDQIFLNLIDRLKIRVTHLKITLLDFQEKPIKEIQGAVSGNGALNINGASANRRTISFNMVANENENNLTNLDNLISLNKKFKVAIGIENPLVDYKHYGDIVWFKGGTYVISKASLSWSTSSCTISISGKDKMCMLDGSVGGTLPATIAFHEIEVQQDNGDIIYEHPTLRRIIFEAVNHYGEEPESNIIINDLDDTIKKLVKYGGDSPLWVEQTEERLDKNIEFTNAQKDKEQYKKYLYGEDVGYTLTDFTYPGELILSAGETVMALLNKIIGVLGNYEFFYDLDGRFVFQRIPNYQDISYTLIETMGTDTYIKGFNNSKYAYSLLDSETVISINNNPNYDNIKNDFIVWGQRPITNSNNTTPICYRLAIDDKPQINLSNKYMIRVYGEKITDTVRYEFWDDIDNIIWKTKEDEIIPKKYYCVAVEKIEDKELETGHELMAVPAKEWREELYRAALEAAAAGSNNSTYDIELLAYWRDNYDPRPKYLEIKYNDDGTKPNIGEEYQILKSEDDLDNKVTKYWVYFKEFWNPDIEEHPDKINYWLDFIDTTTTLGQYSVKNIGRRTKVTNSQDVRSLFNKEVQDIVFVENPKKFTEIQAIKDKMNIDNQPYSFVSSEQYELFLTSATGSSAYDLIREMLYQYLVYNTQVTLTCIPKYYLDSNMLIYIQNDKSGVIGDYVIKSISLPLGYSGTMSITASEALSRI